MQNYVRSYLDKIEKFATAKKERIELLLIGGLAMSFYGMLRYTVDIDAEIRCSNETYFGLLEYLEKEKIPSHISDNISGWGIVPLPANYKERTKIVYKGKYLILKVLDPVDFIFSKLMRGTEEDFRDAIDIIQKFSITKESLFERKSLIQFPKDPETLFFKKKFAHLIDLIK